jgi:hypothetical protein
MTINATLNLTKSILLLNTLREKFHSLSNTYGEQNENKTNI